MFRALRRWFSRSIRYAGGRFAASQFLLHYLKAQIGNYIPTVIIVLIFFGVSGMIWAQYVDAKKPQEANFSLGSFTSGGAVGSGTMITLSGRAVPRFGQPSTAVETEGSTTKNGSQNSDAGKAVFSTGDYWGALMVTSVNFRPSEGLTVLDGRYLPADNLPTELVDIPLEPLRGLTSYMLVENAALRSTESTHEGDRVQLKFKTAPGLRLWPFDTYKWYIWPVLVAPSPGSVLPSLRDAVEARTATFAEGLVKPIPGTADQESREALRTLPIAVGVAYNTEFSAPRGYRLKLGASAGTQFGAPLWIMEINQNLLYPRIGMITIGVLFVLLLILMGWRTFRHGSPLEVGALALTLVFGTSLVADILGEPSLEFPTAVDLLRLIVVVAGFLIVAVNLLISILHVEGKVEPDL